MDPIPGVPTFTWCPAPDPAGVIRLRTLAAQFGDGYKQLAGDGVHNEVQSWPLQFVGRPGRILPIRDFLRERAGYRSFHWRPPHGELGLFHCVEFSLRPSSKRVIQLAATFEQIFRP